MPLYRRDEALSLIRRTQDLPTLPECFHRIQAVLRDESAGADDLAAVIATDQSTTAAVLKCANSVAYNPTGVPIASLRLAISRIGFREAAHIAMTMNLIYGLGMPLAAYSLRSFWAHAYCTGMFCQYMGERLGLDGEECFVVGLLHDIGRLIIAIRLDMNYFESKMARLIGGELVAEELRNYGLDHAEAGGELLRLWRLPKWLCRAVAEHHQSISETRRARLVVLADRAAHRLLPEGVGIEDMGGKLFERWKKELDQLLQEERPSFPAEDGEVG